MKWNRDESNWAELKGRAKRQLYGTPDSGFVIPSSYANKPVAGEEHDLNHNQQAAVTNMPHLYGLENHISSSDNCNEASTHNPASKSMDGC